jgi:hypothetical protein
MIFSFYKSLIEYLSNNLLDFSGKVYFGNLYDDVSCAIIHISNNDILNYLYLGSHKILNFKIKFQNLDFESSLKNLELINSFVNSFIPYDKFYKINNKGKNVNSFVTSTSKRFIVYQLLYSVYYFDY